MSQQRYKSARVMAADRAQRDTCNTAHARDAPARWVTGDGATVIDLRLGRRVRRLPLILDHTHHVQVSPDGACEVHVQFGDGGTLLTLVVNEVAVHVLVNRAYGGNDWFGYDNLFPWLMPGLRGAMGTGMWTRNHDAVIYNPYEDLDVREAHSWANVPVVHAALLYPAGWWAGVRRIPGTAGLRHLTGWASIGVTNARAAREWVATGLRPDDVVDWRAAGWGDQELRVWATDGTGWNPKIAAAFKAAGVGRVHARGWLVNALGLNPRTAGRLHAAGWSPSGASQVRRALKTSDRHLAFAGLVEDSMAGWTGDIRLEQWAASGLNPPAAVTCIQAGLSVAEVRHMVAEGRFDRKVAQVLAALAA